MKSVNEALNGIYIEEEDYTKLNASVSNYTNFDQLELATTLQKHELLEMRRVAGTLYTKVSPSTLYNHFLQQSIPILHPTTHTPAPDPTPHTPDLKSVHPIPLT